MMRDVEVGHTLLLTEKDVAISAREIETLGMTKREAEILCWVAEGKTNPEIAILCDISEHTYTNISNTSIRNWELRLECSNAARAYIEKI